VHFEEEQLAARLGEVIGGRWRLRGLLGVGGMAAVYSAEDPAGNRAAIKLLHREMLLRRDIRERFLREASAATTVNHEGAVAIIDQGTTGDSIYLAMELLEGESLAERVRRDGPLPVAEVLDILDQVLDVLASAHTRGVVHRDLKPENLFLTREHRVKVLDFGLARLLDGAPRDFRTRTGTALGTLPYMAPEQALGRREEIDARTDLFAVGATAFRLLSGRRIHDAASEAELLMAMASKPAPALGEVAPHLPSQVTLIVDRALCFAKAARYPDARCMQRDVREVALGHAPPFALARLTAEADVTRVERGAPAPPEVSQPRGQTSTARLPQIPTNSPSSNAPVPLVGQQPPPSTARTEVMTAFARNGSALGSDTASMPPSQTAAQAPPPYAAAVAIPQVAATLPESEALGSPPATLRTGAFPPPATVPQAPEPAPLLQGVGAGALGWSEAQGSPPPRRRRGLMLAVAVVLLGGGAVAAAALVWDYRRVASEEARPITVPPQVIPIAVPPAAVAERGQLLPPGLLQGSSAAPSAHPPPIAGSSVGTQVKKEPPTPPSTAPLVSPSLSSGGSPSPVSTGSGVGPGASAGSGPAASSTQLAAALPVSPPVSPSAGTVPVAPDPVVDSSSGAEGPAATAGAASPTASSERPGRPGKKRGAGASRDSAGGR